MDFQQGDQDMDRAWCNPDYLEAVTASRRAKDLGCESVTEVSRITDTPKRTLFKWHTTRPLLFDAVCLGSVAMVAERKR